ncbi:PIN domain-containing protein [Kitasatospora sp. RB6PN24]|uniref:PIN domain-containing protein n=1 Tax=Kitasatospora humi TaxID=2893891 RepID=UPI001E416398|nr:PIN domain-containing protein [Kitasatospora humi]MCC9311695.1 PIN domain-containing protein [Kitasatospora humi]
MAFVVVYDACVLYPNTLRDLLIRVARAGMVQAKWTEQILDEVDRALAGKVPDEAKRRRLRELMNLAVRDCLVSGHEPLMEGLKLPDPDDRHVLATAIRAGAQVIVTSNLKDFPASCLDQWNVEAKSPDDFVLDLIGLDERVVYSCAQEIAAARRNPPVTFEDVLTQLERPDSSSQPQPCVQVPRQRCEASAPLPGWHRSLESHHAHVSEDRLTVVMGQSSHPGPRSAHE